MIIRVTQEHILNGNRCNSMSCPIGLAIADAIGEFVIVNGKWVSGYSPDLGTVNLPAQARDFISLYDGAGAEAVRPMEFDLPIDHWLKIIAERKRVEAPSIRETRKIIKSLDHGAKQLPHVAPSEHQGPPTYIV